MKIEQIHLSPQALDNVIISSIESSHREARGLLFGYVKGKTYFCVNSNPILHTNRKPSQVDYTNEAAVKRVVNFARLMNACEERDYTHFGGFHVHPLLENEVPNSLSVLSPNYRDKDGVVWGMLSS